MTTGNNRRYGAIYGTAIGDALGIPYEMKSRLRILEKHPEGIPAEYQAFSRGKNAEWSWEAGEWSDDTDQTLEVLEALLEAGEDGKDLEILLARNLYRWYGENGKGCGGHTRRVLTHEEFLTNPVNASRVVWDRGLPDAPGEKPASNGGVMRTAAVGIMCPWDLDWTQDVAFHTCIVTHYDQRCAASCVAVSVAIACLVQGLSIGRAIDEALDRAFGVNAAVAPWMKVDDLEALDLDGAHPSYTLKALGAGFWALRELDRTRSFLDTILAVIQAGGDTDTNAAVAGALMGAALGYKNLPAHLIDGLVEKPKLHSRVSQVCVQHPFPTTGDS